MNEGTVEAAIVSVLAEAEAALRSAAHAPGDNSPIRLVASPRLRENARAHLADLLAECDDAAHAVADARAQQELCLPSFVMDAVQARLNRCVDAAMRLQATLTSLEALDDVVRAESGTNSYPSTHPAS